MESNNYISIDTCKQIRGIMAIIIMLHHISLRLDFGVALGFVFRQIGATATTIFFFYSGYGLMLGLLKKNDYLKGFFKKRIITVLVPLLVACIAFALYLWAMGRSSEILYRLTDIRYGGTFLPHSWFAVSLLVLYCLFYLSFRWNSSLKKGIIICSTLILAFAVLLCFLQFEQCWYTSLSSFVFGLLYAYYFDRCDEFLKTKKIPKAVLVIIVFILLTAIGKAITNPFIVMVLKNLRAIMACIAILYGSMLVKGNNKILLYFGMISFEFYLYHGVLMDFFASMGRQIVIFTLLVAAANTVVSFVFNRIDNRLVTIIKNF